MNTRIDVANRQKVSSRVEVPLGQQLLNAGFKPITMAQMRERFACDLVSKREKEAAKKACEDFCEDYNKTHFWKLRVIESSWKRSFFANFNNDSTEKIFPHKECNVKIQPLDTYIQDKIPDRCLESIQKARDIGLKEFFVAYPILEEVVLRDPIILGRLDKETLIEIDFWE